MDSAAMSNHVRASRKFCAAQFRFSLQHK